MSLRDVWQKLFDTFVWYNFPSTSSPVNAANLNKMNTAIDGIDDRVLELKTGLDGVTEDLEDKVDKEQGKGLSTNDYDNTAKGIVDGVTSALDDKVDKEQGKGLSTEDFTTEEKTKLAGISSQANKVEITPVVTEGTTLATISIDGVDTDIKGSDIDVDNELSPTSENPVQNKVINSALADINTAISTKADKDGNYEQMTVGNAEQLTSNIFEEDSVPYNFRTSGGTLEIGDREYDTLVGGTVAFNQLVQNGNMADLTGYAFNIGSGSVANNVLTFTSGNGNRNYTSKSATISNILSHKYLICFDYKTNLSFNYQRYASSGYLTFSATSDWKKYTEIVIGNGTTASNTVYFYNYSELAEGDWVLNLRNYAIYDLTQMFGSTIADYIYSLEQATAGSGVAYFKSLFPKDYYDYNAGQLMSVKALSHKMVGFNQFNGENWFAEKGFTKQSDGSWYIANNSGANGYLWKNKVNYAGRMCVSYKVKYGSSTGSAGLMAKIYYTDGTSETDYPSVTTSFTQRTKLSASGKVVSGIAFDYGSANNGSYLKDFNINFSWDGERDGEYEAYEEHIYPLDSDLELRGIPKLDSNNKLYYDGDTYESDGTVTRKYGYRAYQSGDESLTDAITDGTNTVYKLTTPTTETADTFQNPQIVSNWGTEEYTDSRTIQIPVGHITKYPPDLKAKLESAPDSPSSDGDYVLRHNNGENTYVSLEKELPTVPTTDGTYVLKATASSGTATLSWVAE